MVGSCRRRTGESVAELQWVQRSLQRISVEARCSCRCRSCWHLQAGFGFWHRSRRRVDASRHGHRRVRCAASPDSPRAARDGLDFCPDARKVCTTRRDRGGDMSSVQRPGWQRLAAPGDHDATARSLRARRADGHDVRVRGRSRGRAQAGDRGARQARGANGPGGPGLADWYALYMVRERAGEELPR